ncbi:MAG: MATE family efflux transporter [Oscillospiraceae bacterium]|nr:MATE family efflux transporter [Oscillospiraceae bacterium]
MNQLKENKMGIMPVGKVLFQMALPVALSMLVQAFYNVVDSIVVSRISQTDNDALAAVGFAFPVQNIMIGIATGIAVGVNALLSRALGAGDREKVSRVARNGAVLSVMGMLLVAMFGIFFAEPFMKTQTDDIETIAYGVQYIRIITILSFGIFGEVLMERLLQSTGRSTYTMFTQGIGAVINIILDPIFILEKGDTLMGGAITMPFGFGMEVAGAAVATVAGQIVAFALSIYFNLRKNPDVSLSFRGFRPSGKTMGGILGIGVPSMIMVAIGSVMYSTFNIILKGFDSVSSGLGLTGSTVFGAYFKLQSFIFMPIFGISNAVLAITAYNYGARKPERILKTIRYGCVAALTIMAIGTGVFHLVPEMLLDFFNPSGDMVKVGVPALRTISIPFVAAGVCIIFSNVFQALGKSIHSMISSICRQLLVLIPAAYLLSLTGEMDLVWYAFPIAEIASFAYCTTMMIVLYRKKIRTL